MAARKRKSAGGKPKAKSAKSRVKKASPAKKRSTSMKSAKATTTSKRRTTATRSSRRSRGGKVGASPRAAKRVGGRGDFGVGSENPAAQRAASETAKHRTSGNRNRDDRQPRAGVESREAGVGGREGGPGSFSGGDVDLDITGVGTGGVGLAQAGPDDESTLGQAETTGGSEQFASGPPAEGRNQGDADEDDDDLG